MAKRRGSVELSPEFLAAHRPQLDAIGAWTVETYGIDADGGNLDIEWAVPPDLRNDWVPLALRFHTSTEELPPTPGLYDPDDTMFGLYELFAARRDEFIPQLRAVVAETERIVGRVERATVEVYRHRHPDEDMCHCDLQVSLKFADDDEHGYFSRYDSETASFGGLEG